MAHELAGALKQASRIRQRCALKESYVYVRSEYVDVAKGRISQTCGRTAVMQKLSRTSSPHSRITSNHFCAMAPNSPACSFIQPSIAGSRSTAPFNRNNSVLVVMMFLERPPGSKEPHSPRIPWDRRNLPFGHRVGVERPRPSSGDAR
jgi:hypothetical protein